MENSKIEWCDHTFNPWIGCSKVSPGCANCYAEAQDRRWGNDSFGPGKERRRTSREYWLKPLKWAREARAKQCRWQHERDVMTRNGVEATPPGYLERKDAEKPVRPRVFCASLADVFDPEVPRTLRGDLLNLIRMTPELDWLLLTKRPELVMAQLSDCCDLLRDTSDGLPSSDDWSQTYDWLESWINHRIAPENIWLGTTVENQAMADKRVPELLQIPARVRFLSCEPLLGPVMLTTGCKIPPDEDGPWRIGYMVGADDGQSKLAVTRAEALARSGIHWVIAGGESGPGARPMHPGWVRSLRDQCKAAEVAFMFKQWGEWEGHAYPAPGVVHVRMDGSIGDFPLEDSWSMKKVGKAKSGRALDGVLHNASPGSAAESQS